MAYKEDNTPERRTKLDGGLNTHDSPFLVRPDHVVDVSNFRGDGGSLKLRDAAKFQLVVSTDVVGATNGRLPAPTLADIGVGTFPAATYTCKYFLTRWGSSSANGDIGASLSSVGLAVGANRAIEVRISPTNLGEGVGIAAPYDDPMMGGYVSGQVAIYIQSGAGAFEFQGLKSMTWDTTNGWWEVTLSSFVTGLGQNPADKNSYLPVRKVYWYDTSQRALVVYGPECAEIDGFSATGDLAVSANQIGKSVDKNNNPFSPFSRQPTSVDMAEVARVVVATDGLKAKKYHAGGSIARWRMLGANPPDAAPTMALGAAGNPNGVYRYRITFIYSNSRRTSPSEFETWYSESRPTESAGTVTAANQQIVVTFNAQQNETGLLYVRVYRTLAGGSTFYRLIDVPAGNVSTTDNTADADLLGRKTDPDDEGKVPLDVPPNNLILVTPFADGSRLIGVVGKIQYLSAADRRVVYVRGTNQARVSKPQAESYADPNGSDADDIEFTVDHWPNDVDHTVVCGDSLPITALVQYRGAIYVFKEEEIGVISGRAPGQFVYDSLYTDIGAIRDSVVNVADILFFWNAELGAHTFDGRSYQWIGEQVQPSWLADRDATEGYYCVNVVHDREVSEVRWSFTNARITPSTSQVDSTQSNLSTVRGSYKEYVYNTKSGSWWLFSGANQARDVRAAAPIKSVRTTAMLAGRSRVLMGTTIGVLCLGRDTGASAHLDPQGAAPSTTITATATLKVHGLVERWDYVKHFLQLWFSYTTGTVSSGSLLVECKANEATAWVTIGTITATANGLKTEVMDIPAAIGSSINQDRGLQIRFTSTFNAALSIHAIEVRMRDVTPVRKQVRP